jgi:hypothetical protein
MQGILQPGSLVADERVIASRTDNSCTWRRMIAGVEETRREEENG